MWTGPFQAAWLDVVLSHACWKQTHEPFLNYFLITWRVPVAWSSWQNGHKAPPHVMLAYIASTLCCHVKSLYHNTMGVRNSCGNLVPWRRTSPVTWKNWRSNFSRCLWVTRLVWNTAMAVAKNSRHTTWCSRFAGQVPLHHAYTLSTALIVSWHLLQLHQLCDYGMHCLGLHLAKFSNLDVPFPYW